MTVVHLMNPVKAIVRRAARAVGIPMPEGQAYGGMLKPADPSAVVMLALAPGAVVCECGWNAEAFGDNQLARDFQTHHWSGEHRRRMSRPAFDEALWERIAVQRAHPVGVDGLTHSLVMRDGRTAPRCGDYAAGSLSANWRIVDCYTCRGVD